MQYCMEYEMSSTRTISVGFGVRSTFGLTDTVTSYTPGVLVRLALLTISTSLLDADTVNGSPSTASTAVGINVNSMQTTSSMAVKRFFIVSSSLAYKNYS